MRYLFVFLLLFWTAQAGAFFCLSSNKNHHNRSHPPRLARMMPPPPFFPTRPVYQPVNRPIQPITETSELPRIIPTRSEPEIIDGYRFRPIRQKALTENDRSTRRAMDK